MKKKEKVKNTYCERRSSPIAGPSIMKTLSGYDRNLWCVCVCCVFLGMGLDVRKAKGK